jgi:hypothetical protein
VADEGKVRRVAEKGAGRCPEQAVLIAAIPEVPAKPFGVRPDGVLETRVEFIPEGFSSRVEPGMDFERGVSRLPEQDRWAVFHGWVPGMGVMIRCMMDEKLTQPVRNASWKWLFGSAGFGMVVSGAGVSLTLPRLFSWYFEPPASIGVSCSGAVRWAVERVLQIQLLALLVGGMTGFVLALMWRKRQKRHN